MASPTTSGQRSNTVLMPLELGRPEAPEHPVERLGHRPGAGPVAGQRSDTAPGYTPTTEATAAVTTT
jgi:hypothetical protein